MINAIFRNLLIALLLVRITSAQDAEVNTRFRLVSWKHGHPAEVVFLQKGKIQKIDGINPSLRTPFFNYSGPGLMPLYDPGQVSADMEPPPAPIATVRFNPAVKYALVMLVPSAPGKEIPYEAVVFNEDPEKFPFGSFRFQNFSPRDVAADMSGERFVIKPGREGRMIRTPAKAHHLRLALEDNTDKEWRKIYDNFFPNYGGRRTLFIIFETMIDDRPRIQIKSLLESETSWQIAVKPREE